MPTRYNFSAKVQRVRTLLLTCSFSVAALGASFLSDATQNASSLTVSGLAKFFATHPEILLMGIGIALTTLRGELLMKRKSRWEKELFGGLLGSYITIVTLLYVSIKINSVTDAGHINVVADVVMHGYLSSVWLSICCIAAGRS
ncbi:MAG: hypothetical protein ACFB16_02870 [Phormidesmis sp.]